MQTHPSLVERSIGATLKAYKNGQLRLEEAELDLVELIANQITGKTDYAVAVLGFYVRAVLKAFARRQIDLPDAFDAVADAVAIAEHGHMPASLRLSQELSRFHR